MREMMATHKDLIRKIEKLEERVNNNDENIRLVFEYMKKLLSGSPETAPEPPRRIGYRRKDEEED